MFESFSMVARGPVTLSVHITGPRKCFPPAGLKYPGLDEKHLIGGTPPFRELAVRVHVHVSQTGIGCVVKTKDAWVFCLGVLAF